MNIIFDIDGTLVQSFGFDGDCMVQALRDLFGDLRMRPDWADYTHVTDEGIFRGVCADNSLGEMDTAPLKARFAALMHDRLRRDPGVCLATPGAAETMAGLLGRRDVNLGIATGGWGATAQSKLSHAGVPFDPERLFSTEHGVERVTIMRACHDAIADPDVPTVYVGDGEWDMMATGELGWGFIGIGPRLNGRCGRWVADFTGSAFIDHLRELGGFS